MGGGGMGGGMGAMGTSVPASSMGGGGMGGGIGGTPTSVDSPASSMGGGMGGGIGGGGIGELSGVALSCRASAGGGVIGGFCGPHAVADATAASSAMPRTMAGELGGGSRATAGSRGAGGFFLRRDIDRQRATVGVGLSPARARAAEGQSTTSKG
jgi:hypothetical protein